TDFQITATDLQITDAGGTKSVSLSPYDQSSGVSTNANNITNLTSNLSDTASSIRGALTDSVSTLTSLIGDVTIGLNAKIYTDSLAQADELADSASTLRSLITTSGSDDQTLTRNGKTIEIESGNSVDLSFLSDSLAIVDSSAALRSTLSTIETQLSTNL